MVSLFLTDKYVHKYPQRYYTYLLASHLKAMAVMAFSLWIMSKFVNPIAAPPDVLWGGFVLFVFTDILISIPYCRDIPEKSFQKTSPAVHEEETANDLSIDADHLKMASSLIDNQAYLKKIRPNLEKSFLDFIENNFPDLHNVTGDVLILDDINTTENQSIPTSVDLLIGTKRLNDVLRLNQFLQFCVKHTNMSGYFVLCYLPYENFKRNLKAHYTGPFYWITYIVHFVWYRAIPKIPYLEKLYFSPLFFWLDKIHLAVVKKRNRALAKAEVWGRLSFFGMNIIAESEGDHELYIISQRVSQPIQNKIPSFYMITALEKVGLDGEVIHTHKIRTMYPFSEFLQKRIFEDNGLTVTGKFADDFRLTDYGRLLRKYWLDELPQIFDWLRGDVKLIGMRATSSHFLSLYPKELYDLYVQIKPGLIPPIFNEKTNGFDQIVEIELTYLKSYWIHPFRTDIRYFFKTFIDIVFKGVRSK